MFKRFTAILLLVTLISSNFSMFMVYAGFEMNHKYIAENLCINRSRPWMHCNGKCYFMKKIHQAEENEKKQEAKDNLNRLEVSFFQEPFQLSFIEPAILETVKSSFPPYTYQYSSRYIETIFRPPTVSV
ncbi:hypothetical protein BDD43_4908 [Mucilaginibacter gracilis]|uniref:Uncharacterized protein n=2 Tax=Mucilaginibacter gracilis TaxID=423350 RepID=A0A495J9C7_9SPHI|nr:hypothetical protein BDD43_4908 [Mucilaginibacter gracilis]